ncbi:MAG: hypothetical protein B7733_22635 [Myxococcales bacterium FL481]|nr:MAG: hypothetical protein B7733_22635 [Myxococcales bacterium FL481]
MRTVRALLPFVGLFGFALVSPSAARAGEVTRIASSFEEDNPFDLHFGVAYDYNFKRASILREWGRANGSNRLAKDLVYQQSRQTVTPRLEIGLFHDLSLYLDVPIVVSDDRSYALDQRTEPCTFGDDVGGATGESQADCVNKNNSSTIRDSIIPRDGFDASAPNEAYGSFTGEDTETIFRGPTRRGVDQLYVGIKKALINQRRYPHLPTWILALEGRFAVGKPMRFTRDIAIDSSLTEANEYVGRGIHELGAWTALSHRHRFLEPYFGVHWRQGLRASGSQFKRYGDAQDKFNPMSTAGFFVGGEIIPWERKATHQKIALAFSGSTNLRYDGREYSEVWELLSDSPALVGTNNPGRARCNIAAAVAHAKANPLAHSDYLAVANQAPNSGGCSKFNGITTVQNYAEFALRVALNVHLSSYARLVVGANLGTTTRHFVTSADRGDPGTTGDPDVVEAETTDVNPIRRDVIDNVGRRYAVDDMLNVRGFARFWLTF